MESPVEKSSTVERRGGDRTPYAGDVTVHFAAEPIVGPGRNISREGVFFVAEGSVRVRVTVDGSDRERIGELVRVESMGEGRIGLAIRFLPDVAT
jgi:hypothetical protein